MDEATIQEMQNKLSSLSSQVSSLALQIQQLSRETDTLSKYIEHNVRVGLLHQPKAD